MTDQAKTDPAAGMLFLACDAPGCDVRVPIETFSAEHIGRPCPECGASLLTREDYEDALPTFQMLEALTRAGLARALTPEERAPGGAIPEGMARVSVRVKDGQTHVDAQTAIPNPRRAKP